MACNSHTVEVGRMEANEVRTVYASTLTSDADIATGQPPAEGRHDR